MMRAALLAAALAMSSTAALAQTTNLICHLSF